MRVSRKTSSRLFAMAMASAVTLLPAGAAIAFDAYDNPRPDDCANQSCHPEQAPPNVVYVDSLSAVPPTGDWAAPYPTVQAGLDRLCTGGGDKTSVCVLGVTSGTRFYNETVAFNCSGTKENPLLLSPIDGMFVTLNKYNAGVPAIAAYGQSNIVIRGMRTFTTYRGIGVRGLTNTEAGSGAGSNLPPRENIYLIGNHTQQTCSSGIHVAGMDGSYLRNGQSGNYDDGDHLRNVAIRNNTIRDANDGCASEKLTVAFGVANVYAIGNDISGDGLDPLASDGGEGIDFKSGVYGGAMLRNVVHDQVKRAYYIDGGTNDYTAVRDILIEGNIARNITRSGFGVMSEGGGDVSNIRIQNNLVEHVGTQGVVIYRHPDQTNQSEITDINVVNNTIYNADYLDTSHAISISLPGATGTVQNNLVYATPSGDSFSIPDDNTMLVQANFCDQPDEGCTWTGDPGVAADFKPLDPASAIVDRGLGNGQTPAADFDGQPRDALPDIGAFEWQSPPPPPPDDEISLMSP